MGMNPPIPVIRALTILQTVAEVVQAVSDLAGLVEDPNAGLEYIASKVNAIHTNTAGLSDEIAAVSADLAADIQFIKDRTEAIENKASTVQMVLTGAAGFIYPPTDWPTLDLRNDIGAIIRYMPGSGSLFEWLSFLARSRPPLPAGNLTNLGPVVGDTTLALPACWAVRLDTTVEPAGFGGSTHPAAPVSEWRARVSFGAKGGYAAAQLVHHPVELLTCPSFLPSSLAIEPRPGLEFNVWAVTPQGEI